MSGTLGSFLTYGPMVHGSAQTELFPTCLGQCIVPRVQQDFTVLTRAKLTSSQLFARWGNFAKQARPKLSELTVLLERTVREKD